MRAHAANIFFHSRLAHVASSIRAMLCKDLPILAYHRVCTVQDALCYPFDIELVSASVADFAWQMAYVSEHFTPITFAHLARVLDGDEQLPTCPIIITFDDGFLDNYEHAFPVLQRLGIPATIFLATGYIGAPRTFWYDWLAFIVNRVPACTWRIDELGMKLRIEGAVGTRREPLRRLLECLKHLPDGARLTVLEKIEKVWGHIFDGADLALSRTLGWEQVREMAAAGIEFGSHSVTHPILTQLDDETLRRELADSKRVIEQHIGAAVTALAYPVGRSFAFDRRVMASARECGYRIGVSYVRGTNQLSSLQPFALKRISVERFVDRGHYASMLSLPEVFLG